MVVTADDDRENWKEADQLPPTSGAPTRRPGGFARFRQGHWFALRSTIRGARDQPSPSRHPVVSHHVPACRAGTPPYTVGAVHLRTALTSRQRLGAAVPLPGRIIPTGAGWGST